jgi:hypothetical protein
MNRGGLMKAMLFGTLTFLIALVLTTAASSFLFPGTDESIEFTTSVPMIFVVLVSLAIGFIEALMLHHRDKRSVLSD